MNIADVLIIGTLILVSLLGFKMGILKPLFNFGGIALGGFLASRHSAEAARLLEPYIDFELGRRGLAFLGIMLIVVATSRIMGYFFRKMLANSGLGMVDHGLGMLGAMALGVVAMGTVSSVMASVSFGGASEAFKTSPLANGLARASVVTLNSESCDEQGSCSGMDGVVGKLIGNRLSDQINNTFGGQEAGMVVDMVKGFVSGSPQDLISIAQQNPALAEGTSQITALSNDSSYCKGLETSGSQQSCSGLQDVFNQVLSGGKGSEQSSSASGQDIGTLMDVVKGTLSR